MASKDPIESAAKGATEGALGWTEEKVKQLGRAGLEIEKSPLYKILKL